MELNYNLLKQSNWSLIEAKLDRKSSLGMFMWHLQFNDI